VRRIPGSGEDGYGTRRVKKSSRAVVGISAVLIMCSQFRLDERHGSVGPI